MKRFGILAVMLIGSGSVIGACLTTTDITPDCLDPGDYTVDEDGHPVACSPNPNRCPGGECVVKPALDWAGPTLLWFGAMDEPLPDCPHDRAPAIGYEGFADIVAPDAVCPACSCEPPTGSCELPSKIEARASACPGAGSWTTPFNGPAGWDGSCTNVNAIPQGLDCGGAPCVQSLTIGPLSVVEGACGALQGPPPQPFGPISWKTHARACMGKVIEGFCASGSVCVPAPGPPPPQFRQCMFIHGDEPCPDYTPYQDRFVFYNASIDGRGCSSCNCGPPMGSTCTAAISVYQGNTCSVPLFENYSFDSSGSACVDVKPGGSALGSKQISNITYHPGTCEPSGGEPIGAVEPDKPATFCCLPEH